MPMLARTTNRQAGKQANRRTPKSQPLLLGRLRVQCRLEKGLLLWRNRHYLQLQKYPQNHLPQFPTRLDFLDSSQAPARILPERAYSAHSSRAFPRDLVQATLPTRTRVFTEGIPQERFRVGYYRSKSRPIPRTREAPHKPLLPSLPFSPLLPLSRLPPHSPRTSSLSSRLPRWPTSSPPPIPTPLFERPPPGPKHSGSPALCPARRPLLSPLARAKPGHQNCRTERSRTERATGNSRAEKKNGQTKERQKERKIRSEKIREEKR